MNKISLRIYEKEIEDLIDKGQTDEAISHCAHILNQIPKHVDTYRLMGKAYLESQRFSEASDVFQRALAVIPDDFVSNLGMSIIKENENDLDAATWHMERAYEFQPSNPSIQNELQRLRIRRDGIEPPRVRLTRGALVRMYERGHLYPQAIAEIKAALAEDPNRNDLLIILARVYQLTGKNSEALETCTHLIADLPYCLEANRILTDILVSMGQSDDAAPYKQRLIDLDPYYAYVTEPIPTVNLVPDNAVMIERYDPLSVQAELGQIKVSQEINLQLDEQVDIPSVGSSFNFDLTEEADNLSNAIDETKNDDELEPVVKPDGINENASAQMEVESDDILPDWMKEAGWNIENSPDSSSVPTETLDVLDEDHPIEDEAIQSAEIPLWVQAMAPENTQSPQTDENNISDELPSANLEEFNPESGYPESLTADRSIEDLDVQPQINETDGNGLPYQSENNIAESVMEEKMDNFKPQDPSFEDEGLPDWLKEFASNEKEKDDRNPSPLTENKEQTPDTGNSSDLEDAMAWLESLAASQASDVVNPETLESLPEEPDTTQPPLKDDVKEDDIEEPITGLTPEIGDFGKILSEFPHSSGESSIFEKGTQSSPENQSPEMGIESEQVPDIPEAELISFPGINLNDIEKEEPPLEEETAEPEIDFSDTSEYPWLDSLTRISKEDAIPESDILGKQDEIPPSWVIEFSKKDNDETRLTSPESDLEAEILQPESELSEDELPAWLKEISSAQDTYTEPDSTNLPDWLKQLDSEEMGFTEEPVEQQPAIESEWTKEEIPVSDLLNQPEQVLPDSDLPDWLKGLEQQTPISIENLASESTTFTNIFTQAPVSETEGLILEAEEPLENIEAVEIPAPVDAGEPPLSNNVEIPLLQPEELFTGGETALPTSDEINIAGTVEEEIPVSQTVESVEEATPVISGSLENARILLDQGKIDVAVEEYNLLIGDGISLDEILFDIEKALYRHPVDIGLWQTYGDALAKSNRLQDALDAYTKAEELLK